MKGARGEGVKKSEIFADVINGSPLTQIAIEREGGKGKEGRNVWPIDRSVSPLFTPTSELKSQGRHTPHAATVTLWPPPFDLPSFDSMAVVVAE